MRGVVCVVEYARAVELRRPLRGIGELSFFCFLDVFSFFLLIVSEGGCVFTVTGGGGRVSGAVGSGSCRDV